MKKNYVFLLCLLVTSVFFGCKQESEEQKGDSVLPKIEIKSEKLSTENKNNDFITEPVSDSVKESSPWYNNKPSPYYKDCTITVYDKNGVKTISEANAEVKVRGNWTTSYAKKGLRIKFAKKEKQNLLGLNDGNEFRNWVLLASYKDWSFLRDMTGHTLGRLISPDYYSTDSTLVELYANKEYLGVYVLAEQQEINENRVDITDAEDESSVNVGYLIEYDKYYVSEDKECVFTIKHGEYDIYDRNNNKLRDYNIGYTIKNDLNNIKQRDFIESYMNNLWKLCYEAVYNNVFYKFDDDYNLVLDTDVKNAKECVSKYVDLQSLVETYILHEIVCDPDLYLTSFYMDIDLSKDNPKKLTFEAPWDFDSTMGNKRHCSDAEGFFVATVGKDVNYSWDSGSGNPWLMMFVRSDWFNQMVSQKWSQVKNQGVLDKITEQIDFFTTNYASAFRDNYEKWDNIGHNDWVGNELCEESAACKTQKESANRLKSWIIKRFNNLDELFSAEMNDL